MLGGERDMTSSNARNADKKHCHVIRASCMSIIPPQGFKCWCFSLSGSPLSASVPFEVPEKDAERSSSDLLLLGVNRSSVPQTFLASLLIPSLSEWEGNVSLTETKRQSSGKRRRLWRLWSSWIGDVFRWCLFPIKSSKIVWIHMTLSELRMKKSKSIYLSSTEWLFMVKT